MNTKAFNRTATFALALAAVFAMSVAVATPASASDVVAWGNNAFGQLGNGTTTTSDTPVFACEPAGCSSGPLGHVKAVATGNEHSLALLEDGEVVAWGDNGFGDLGDGTTTNRSLPVPVCEVGYSGALPCPAANRLKNVKAVSAGTCDSMALLESGKVVAWGLNHKACGAAADGEGELGNGTTTDSSVPVYVCEVGASSCSSGQYLENVTAISSGAYHNLALRSNGTVAAWGLGQMGQLGNGEFTGNHVGRLVPVGVCKMSYVGAIPCPSSEYLKEVVEISAGSWYGLARLSDNEVRSWGENQRDELGHGTASGPANNSDLPVEVCEVPTSPPSGECPPATAMMHATAISASDSLSGFALLESGTLAGWGYNGQGQLGQGPAPSETSEPLKAMTGVTGISAVSAGYVHSLVLQNSGLVWAAGNNPNGELGNGTTTNSNLPVHVCAVGASSCASGSYLEHVFAIAAGPQHNLAIVPPPLCGPPNSPGGQGTAGVCNWYSSSVILPAGTRKPFTFWGGWTSGSMNLVQTSGNFGEINCKTAGWGTIENPTGGGPGVGKIFGLGFYSCISPQCAGGATATALNLAMPWWTMSLSEGGTPYSVTDQIGEPFSGTFGSPGAGEMVVKVVCGSSTAVFEGELEPEIGIGTGPTGPGLNGPSPAEISFTGASTGALHSAGGEDTYNGLLKYSIFPSGKLEVW